MRSFHLAAAALLLAAPVPLAAQLRIAIVGDSIASGEGNPDAVAIGCVPGPGPGGRLRNCARFPTWLGRRGRGATATDAACHRSTASGLLRAAERLRSDLGNPPGMVIETFACSGATTGTVGNPAVTTSAFSAVEPFGPVSVPAQLVTLASDPQFINPATGNRIDAIIMTVGANDIGFAGMAATCALDPRAECYRIPGGVVTGAIAGLPGPGGRYAALQANIRALLGGRVGNVFIVQYHNPSFGPHGPCGATTALEPGGPRVRPPDFADLPLFWGMSWYESRFVTDVFVPTLNAAVAAGAAEQGWRLVGGAEQRFRGHGHCAGPRQRWVLNLADTFAIEGGHWGVIHPNPAGHNVLRDLVREALQPYTETLVAPTATAFSAPLARDDTLGWSGGSGPRRQVALLDLPSADPRVPPGPPPGFPGDGVRQRVTADAAGRLTLRQFDPAGTPWALVELSQGDRIPIDPDRHFAAAVRSCNELICSGWGPAAVTPPSTPRFVYHIRTASGAVIPAWAGHRRNGLYQVAVPTGRARWDIFVVGGSATGELNIAQPILQSSWSEAGPSPATPPSDRAADRVGGNPVMVAGTSARVAEYHVRGCNQTGCSAWASAADYVNALAIPAPQALTLVMSPLPCDHNGHVSCGAADQGRRGSNWAAVPGANVYQIAAYRRDGTIEYMTATGPGAVIDRDDHVGLRVRACNVAGCSAWSPAILVDPGTAPPPPANAAAPANLSMVAATGAPPRTLPRP